MKTTYIKLLVVGLTLSMAGCSLDYDPVSEYSEVTVGGTEEDGEEVKFKDRSEMLTQYNGLYNRMKGNQEHWYLDLMMINEAHADNAYVGTTGAEVVPYETNLLDAGSSILDRDWNRYLADIAAANTIINNIDAVPDASFSQSERDQWKAEAKIYRAMIMFEMARLWGQFPVITVDAGDITSENITEVYPAYFPPQNTAEEVYAQIIQDLTEALPSAPANNAADKSRMSKSVAKALLAKIYAEKTVRDYSKVLSYCNEVIADGFSLVADYETLFGMNEAGTDCRARNTSESIFEIPYPVGSGSWVTWMFGRNLINWDQSFTWAKWVTPSRDLIKAYQSEGDEIRMNQSIVFYSCTWSNYYPANNYAFMYKIRSEVNSILKLRLADILLYKAEAQIMTGDLAGAASTINQIRARVKLPALDSSATGSKESMINALLKERRLELAMEGTRWYDLCRLDKVEEVMNGLNSRDEGRLKLARPYNPNSYLMPVPQPALDQNVNLVQNPGY